MCITHRTKSMALRRHLLQAKIIIGFFESQFIHKIETEKAKAMISFQRSAMAEIIWENRN